MPQILDLNPDELLVKSYLERALDGSNPSLVGLRMMQRFANETPQLFCNAAVSLVEPDNTSSTGLRFMTSLLLKQPQLLKLLADPERLDRVGAVRLFRQLVPFDRSLDVRMARCLPNRHGSSDIRLELPSCERALDVLDEVSEGRRLVPILGHLIDHPLGRIASKATLLIGRRVQSVTWAKRFLGDDQTPRNRANAIEALWGLNSPDARELFWEHSSDQNNRVTGNAVFGLHVLGDEKAAPAVRRMARRLEAEFRWTSAWLMGKMAQPTFVEELKGMIKDDNPGVRRASFKALVDIRQEDLRRQEAEQQVVLSGQASEEQKAQIVALSEAIENERGKQPELGRAVAPEFNLRLDGRSYSFRQKS
jgi:HEAT repeat protein